MCTVNKKDFSYMFSTRSNVVITGDSLAYNRYDFMMEPRTNAWECYSGMASWSFLLRNYLIRHQSDFIPARKTIFSSEIPYKYFTESTFSCLVPFMEEGICIELKPFEQVTVDQSNTGMYLLTDPEHGGRIAIDDVEIDITGNREIYGGHEIKLVSIKNGNIKCLEKKVRLNIIGFSKTGNQVFLTGSGSKTTRWLADNLNERVMNYSPDLLIMIIGANDRANSSVKEAYESMKTILDTVKCEVLILTTPHSSTTDPDTLNEYIPDKVKTKPLIDNLYRLSDEYAVPMIDLFRFFSGTESKIWRYDNVHFSVKGNEMLYNYIVKEFFGG
ncbi:MAG: SGNH/GDSL hydrolase family protein [Clostridia bacterium]|nr:SGNH/GDSL hydrolase family protein [Clostridia bacterium]